MRRIWLLVISVVVGCLVSQPSWCYGKGIALAEKLYLIKSAIPSFDIVVPDNEASDEKLAATEMALYIGKACGTTPAIKVESEADDGQHVYLGNTRFSQNAKFDFDSLDDDGFLIMSVGCSLVIRGSKPQGTLFGVYRFLYKYLGIRWYMPTDLGEHVPGRTELAIRSIKDVENPDVLSRHWSEADKITNDLWDRRNLMRRRFGVGHTCYTIFDRMLFDEHPEWFPLYDGARYKPKSATDWGWQPCMTSEGGIKHAASLAKAYFDKYPDEQYFMFAMNDSGRFCECPTCKPLIKRPGVLGSDVNSSDLVFYFVDKVARELAKTYPDKYVTTLAYAGCESPPTSPISPQIVPFITIDPAEYYDPVYRETSRRIIREWSNAVPHIAFWNYYYGYNFVIPRIFTRYSAESIKMGKKHNLMAFHAELYANWSLDGPKAWVASQLLWDADQGTKRLLNDYYKNMFAEAAVPMRKYFELCEKQWTHQPGKGKPFRLIGDPAQLIIFTPDACRKALAFLADAERLAKDEKAKKRVQVFSDAFRLTAMYVDVYHGERELTALPIRSNADVDAALAGLKNLLTIRRNVVSYYHKKILKNDLTRPAPPAFNDYAGTRLLSIIPKVVEWSDSTGSWDETRDKLNKFSSELAIDDVTQAVEACIHLHDQPSAGVELIDDGGFERSADVTTKAWDVSTYGLGAWDIWYRDATLNELTSTQDSHSGESAVRIAAKLSKAGTTAVSQTLPVEAGKVYVMSLYAKGRVSPGAVCGLTMLWLDEKSVQIDSALTYSAILPEGFTDDWALLSTPMQAPTNAKYLRISAVANGQRPGDYFVFDDMSVKQVAVD